MRVQFHHPLPPKQSGRQLFRVSEVRHETAGFNIPRIRAQQF
jgi:hypothetical protein